MDRLCNNQTLAHTAVERYNQKKNKQIQSGFVWDQSKCLNKVCGAKKNPNMHTLASIDKCDYWVQQIYSTMQKKLVRREQRRPKETSTHKWYLLRMVMLVVVSLLSWSMLGWCIRGRYRRRRLSRSGKLLATWLLTRNAVWLPHKPNWWNKTKVRVNWRLMVRVMRSLQHTTHTHTRSPYKGSGKKTTRGNSNRVKLITK